MNQSKLTPEVQVLLDKVTTGLQKATDHFLFEPIDQDTLHRLEHSINEVFNRWLPEGTPVGEYLTVKIDPDDRNSVVVCAKPDSPDCVYDLFRVMRGL